MPETDAKLNPEDDAGATTPEGAAASEAPNALDNRPDQPPSKLGSAASDSNAAGQGGERPAMERLRDRTGVYLLPSDAESDPAPQTPRAAP